MCWKEQIIEFHWTHTHWVSSFIFILHCWPKIHAQVVQRVKRVTDGIVTCKCRGRNERCVDTKLYVVRRVSYIGNLDEHPQYFSVWNSLSVVDRKKYSKRWHKSSLRRSSEYLRSGIFLLWPYIAIHYLSCKVEFEIRHTTYARYLKLLIPNVDRFIMLSAYPEWENHYPRSFAWDPYGNWCLGRLQCQRGRYRQVHNVGNV